MIKFRLRCFGFRTRQPIIPLNIGNSLGLICLLLGLLLCGCATTGPAFRRPFVFKQDTFAFANELVWEYRFDPATAQTLHTRRKPPPAYTHHCFVIARSARQFFQHARFDPGLAKADEATYRNLIERVVSTSPRRNLKDKIVIPGYANLYAFSQAQERLLKAGCGGAWQSYFQRGHWRMIFPLTRRHQEKMAEQLTASLKGNRPPVVHLVRFPSLSINHAVVLFGLAENDREIQFAVYDPNRPEQPAQLIYDRSVRRFTFPANNYFAGGRVDVYEIYRAWNY
jgi:hypothetical protein